VGAVAAMLVALAGARAETCTLDLKRLESTSTGVVVGGSTDYLYRSVSAQYFYMDTRSIRRTRVGAEETSEFSEVIRKEPAEYHSEHPFRGVARLGTQEYGFVFDSKDAESKGYGRLYLDRNHNGDLTDDEVIEAERERDRSSSSYTYVYSYYPRVDLTIEAGGTKLDYAFTPYVYVRSTDEYSYGSARFTSAAYREGEITLDGKKRHVVVLDHNSNGRFDDQSKILPDVMYSGGRVYAQYGDKLLVDPGKATSGYRSPYDVSTSDDQHYVSKLVNVDGRFYDLEISPAGDKLSLTPSSAPIGFVANPNERFRAIVYGDQGFLKLSGNKAEPLPLPEGEWKLLSYTIDRTGWEKPSEEVAGGENEEEPSLLQSLSTALAGPAGPQVSRPRYSILSAGATKGCKPVSVRKGETVALPFGPPFKALVNAPRRTGGDTVYLEMSIVGSGGEVCSNLTVDGNRPPKPEFTISKPDGEVVETGNFEWG
jgi:hypothetical protein